VIVGIETGGTSVRWALATAPDAAFAVVSFPTRGPDETIDRLVREVRAAAGDTRLVGAGLAAFGPLDVDPGSARYGTVLATPKPGWADTPLAARLADGLGLGLAVESDVNAAAVAECRLGAARGLDHVAYVTVGTGVGVGAVVGGRPLHGHRGAHPELGHLPVRRHPEDRFPGVCPFHADCLEGLASGPAIAARWGRAAEDLVPDLAAARRMEAFYLAQLVAAVTYTLSPGCVVLGGGVSRLPGLLGAVRRATAVLVSGALAGHPVGDPAGDYVRAPGLGERAGLVGALLLAADTRPPGGR
jgi:fructokinase